MTRRVLGRVGVHCEDGHRWAFWWDGRAAHLDIRLFRPRPGGTRDLLAPETHLLSIASETARFLFGRTGKVDILVRVGTLVLQELEEFVETGGEKGAQKWSNP